MMDVLPFQLHSQHFNLVPLFRIKLLFPTPQQEKSGLVNGGAGFGAGLTEGGAGIGAGLTDGGACIGAICIKR